MASGINACRRPSLRKLHIRDRNPDQHKDTVYNKRSRVICAVKTMYVREVASLKGGAFKSGRALRGEPARLVIRVYTRATWYTNTCTHIRVHSSTRVSAHVSGRSQFSPSRARRSWRNVTRKSHRLSLKDVKPRLVSTRGSQYISIKKTPRNTNEKCERNSEQKRADENEPKQHFVNFYFKEKKKM